MHLFLRLTSPRRCLLSRHHTSSLSILPLTLLFESFFWRKKSEISSITNLGMLLCSEDRKPLEASKFRQECKAKPERGFPSPILPHFKYCLQKQHSIRSISLRWYILKLGVCSMGESKGFGEWWHFWQPYLFLCLTIVK